VPWLPFLELFFPAASSKLQVRTSVALPVGVRTGLRSWSSISAGHRPCVPARTRRSDHGVVGDGVAAGVVDDEATGDVTGAEDLPCRETSQSQWTHTVVFRTSALPFLSPLGGRRYM